MRVLSLFDGISCGQVALQRIGIKPSVYFASEIDKSAIAITQRNFPDTVQLGGVQDVRAMVDTGLLGQIDLVIGGSPCQGFSKAGKNLGFADPRSQLLFDYVSIRHRFPNAYFLLENVRMKAPDLALVDALIGASSVEIDSALFSGQRRKRHYWTNIPIAPIVDQGVHLWSVIDWTNKEPANAKWHQWFWRNHVERLRKGFVVVAQEKSKAATLTARQYANWNGNVVRINDAQLRWLTVNECEKLQTLPVDYCKGASLFDAYKAIGNGWTVDVIAHILKGMLR
jgi:site-specific DNA-cytosine methylase